MAFATHLNQHPKTKRHLWLISLGYPLMPLLGIGFTELTGNPYMMFVPLVLFYIMVPILDTIVGDDRHDLLGLMEAEASLSPFYRYMVHGLLPIIYATWLIGAWYAATQDLPWAAYGALAVAHGWGLGFAINSGHETGHKTDKLSKWVALLMLAPGFYGHFRLEHNQGHHSDVATPKDSATARFGESYYSFMLREYLGTWKRAWRIETKRARRRGHSKWSFKNEVVISVLMSSLLWGSVIAWLGAVVIPYILIAWLVSVSLLSAQNYIAHYGLLRDRRPDGKFLPCEPKHSWNCNSLVTNLITYNLARHSDHHANPSRHYQHLRTFPDAPQLPYGYGVMYLLAYVPPLYRRVMDPLVLENVGGDLNRVLTKDMVEAYEKDTRTA